MVGWLLLGVFGVTGLLAISAALVANKVPVRLASGFFYLDKWDSYVTARGTWTIDGQKSGIPLQATEIACFRETMTCDVAQAEIFMSMLTASYHAYQVTRWTDELVTFIDTSPICFRYTYSIIRTSKSAVGKRAFRNDADATLCEEFDKKDLQLTFQNGFDVWRSLDEQARAEHLPWVWAALGVWGCVVLALCVRSVRRPTHA